LLLISKGTYIVQVYQNNGTSGVLGLNEIVSSWSVPKDCQGVMVRENPPLITEQMLHTDDLPLYVGQTRSTGMG
jgi:hypothetical protein